ncbi:Pyridoxamine 5'-phosphate oxidase family protein [Trifolium repens]|nr:Pyridoxamine 5'-phosphate oxidase family protein [Trifolium repens]
MVNYYNSGRKWFGWGTRAGLFRTPISGGVQSATSAHALAVHNLMEQVDETTKKYFTDAFMVHQLACGNRKKPNWIFPKTRVQPNDNDCGYYVMKNMIDIVSASVTKKWDEVFNDSTALSEDDLYELRNRWATCFLGLYNPENDYDDGAKGRR